MVDKLFPCNYGKFVRADRTYPQPSKIPQSNPHLSAYAQLKVEFSYNKTPFAPPGTKALMYFNPKERTSWAPLTTDAWYACPALKCYRCYYFWVSEIRDVRITQTTIFFQNKQSYHQQHMQILSSQWQRI